MKLRIQRNSLRVRLTQTEVAALAAGETITQTTSFTHGVELISAVQTSRKSAVPSASLHQSRLTLVLPYERVRQWAHSDEVSIQAQQAVDEHTALSLLIEKDFECLHGPEENRDAFPNPHTQETA